MINLLKVFVSPGEVFESMRSYIPAIPPLVILVLCLCIFPALRGWFVSDEEYLRIIEASFESSSEFSSQFAEVFAQTLVRGEGSDEEIEDTLALHRELTEEQRKKLTTEEGIQSARKLETFFGPLTLIFGYGLLVLLEATYFLIAGNMMKISKQWSDWIGYTLWTMMPLVLFLLLSTLPTLWFGTIDPYRWQAPMAWIPGLETNVFALTLTIPTLWIVWIRIVAMYRWIEKPMPICLVVVFIPALVVWLISAGSLQLANPYIM